jgi:hypothetical protein
MVEKFYVAVQRSLGIFLGDPKIFAQYPCAFWHEKAWKVAWILRTRFEN